MSQFSSPNALIYPGVHLGDDALIDPWVVLGYPSAARGPDDLLRIGHRAVIRSHTVIYAGSVIGDGFRTGHGALVRESNEIGDDVSIGSHAVVEHHVRLADRVRIHTGAFIPEFSIVEADAWVGPHVVFTNAVYPLARNAKETLRGPHLMPGAKIGANATLLPRGHRSARACWRRQRRRSGRVRRDHRRREPRARRRHDRRHSGLSITRGRSGRRSPLNVPLVDLKAQYGSIKPEIDAAIQRVLDHTGFILGDEVRTFEAAFAERIGADGAVGVASGTAALQLALQACGVGPGDEVITTAHTFIATAEPIALLGAMPVFVDIDPATFNLDPERVEDAITSRTKAIVPVHLYGRPAAMDELLQIADRHGLVVIEDAAQAHGACYRGRACGTIGSIGCFSFYPGKNLGAYGDAGAVTSNDPDLLARVRKLRDHGRTSKYEHDEIGYGERIDALQAAILGAKLPHLTAWTDARRRHARRYTELLAGTSVTTPTEDPGDEHVFHLYVVRSTVATSSSRISASRGRRRHPLPDPAPSPAGLPEARAGQPAAHGAGRGRDPVAADVSRAARRPDRVRRRSGPAVRRMTVNVAIVGLGYWGPNLARNIAILDGGRLHTLCDAQPDRLARHGRQYPGTRTTTDFETVLADDEVDAVVLATPVASHFELAKRAMDAGKHVMVEKPLARTSAECAELVELADRAGLTLMVGHVFLYNAAVRRMKDYIDSGELGDVQYIYSQRLNLGQVRHDVNALWNFAPHDLSILMYWLGQRARAGDRARLCLRPARDRGRRVHDPRLPGRRRRERPHQLARSRSRRGR